MVGPYPLAGIKARVATVPALRFVGISADLAAALKSPPNVFPAAYLVREERAHPPMNVTGEFLQKVDVAVALVLFVRNYSESAAGGGARDEMDALIGQCRARVVGWRPSGEYAPLALDAGNENIYSGAMLVSQEVYKSTYRMRIPA